MSGWNYYRAIEEIARLARLEDRRRQVLGCSCGALFLTRSVAPDAQECGPCYQRERRLAEEAVDRAAYRRYLDGQGRHPFPEPVESEPELEPSMQGSLF